MDVKIEKMKIDVEKIKTAYEAASAEQKEQIEKMFPGAFECAKSKDPEETLNTLVDKLEAWQGQNKEKRAVALFMVDEDRTKEEGNTAICITGPTATLVQLVLTKSKSGAINNPLVKLFALAFMINIKDGLKDSKHGTDN